MAMCSRLHSWEYLWIMATRICPPLAHFQTEAQCSLTCLWPIDAFPLKTNLMKPYPGTQAANSAKRIYNYRLSRARRCVENAFGVMCARWRVLRNRMSLLPDNAVLVVAACCCLHNFLMQEGRQVGGYCPPQFAYTTGSSGELISGDWRNSTPPIPQAYRQGSNTYSRRAADVRDSFASYFHGPGAVPWQFT